MRSLSFSFILSFALGFGISSGAAASNRICESLFADKTKHEVAVALATSAGLHYSTEKSDGIKRVFADGKYTYRYEEGAVVTDHETLSRIQKLVLPPGYTDVWISGDPLSHIQARAVDKRLRPQYRYHDAWTNQVLVESKFRRLHEFGLEISALRKVAELDLHKNKIDNDSKTAAIVRLLETAGIRIGSDRYALNGASYGLATLEIRHVEVEEDKLRFRFVAKESIEQDIEIVDASVARIVRFSMQNKSPNDRLFDVDSIDVNRYIKAHIGNQFSAKDFRTWVGSVVAARALHEIGFKNDKKSQEFAMKFSAETAARRLHNTATVARDSYILPKIFEAYRNQTLDNAFREVVDPELSPEENAVLFLSGKY